MGTVGGGIFLIAIFAAIFITPFVLGAYVVVGGGQQRVFSTYFAFITGFFVLAVGVGIVATLALMAA